MKREFMNQWETVIRVVILVALALIILILGYAFAGALEPDPVAPVFHEVYDVASYNVAGEERFIYVISFEFQTMREAFEFVSKIEQHRGEK